ncbi:O-antigen ligase family protein [Halomonas sp. ML-15]|uniref:O-antigen ligase family protein n=1 Tax=Halomonas sp. ML-15 TaxID=2773305 RepID=UPI001747017C|nr:O-antigen ligase family protein [Halomonas sp. ML-15]MBD3896187.1 O-antigen ligase family protein [Halomonas sp. ML-15]
MSLMLERAIGSANSLLVLAFIALLVLIPDAYRWVAVAGLGVLGVAAATARGSQYQRLDRDDAWFCLALIVYGVIWLADVWRSGHWPMVHGAGPRLLPLWPLLAALLLVGLRCYPPNPRMLWWGVGVGALGVGAVALYERFLLGLERASNGINAIPFGNLSLLLGSLAALAVLWCWRHRSFHYAILMVLAMLAAVFGLLASLLSGTRGGWVALPFVMLLVYRAARDLLPRRYLRLGAGCLTVVVLAVAILPQSGVGERLGHISEDAHRYWQQGRAGNSLGMRLELWRAGAIMVSEKPLFGYGERHTELGLRELAEAGRVYDRVIIHVQLHNEAIDTAARRGLLGVASLLLLYVIPFGLFWKKLRRAGRRTDLQLLAVAGMMVPLAFFTFGLTQSMLRDLRGLSGYLGLCVVCWAALRAREEALQSAHLGSCGLHPSANIEDDEDSSFVRVQGADHERSQ